MAGGKPWRRAKASAPVSRVARGTSMARTGAASFASSYIREVFPRVLVGSRSLSRLAPLSRVWDMASLVAIATKRTRRRGRAEGGSFQGLFRQSPSPKRAAARDDAGAARPSLPPSTTTPRVARVRVGSLNSSCSSRRSHGPLIYTSGARVFLGGRRASTIMSSS